MTDSAQTSLSLVLPGLSFPVTQSRLIPVPRPENVPRGVLTCRDTKQLHVSALILLHQPERQKAQAVDSDYTLIMFLLSRWCHSEGHLRQRSRALTQGLGLSHGIEFHRLICRVKCLRWQNPLGIF